MLNPSAVEPFSNPYTRIPKTLFDALEIGEISLLDFEILCVLCHRARGRLVKSISAEVVLRG